MKNKTINTEQGHWILAKMGKKVLRPGGLELTEKLIDGLQLNVEDKVVEFAPGIGITAELIWAKKPQHYTGVELNEEAAANLEKKVKLPTQKIVNSSAADTGLTENSVDKLIGEAMLTMQADHRKSEIIREAYRILKPGGIYAIHELGLRPDDLDPAIKKDIQQNLAKSIKVNARPLTLKEWKNLLKEEGFTVKEVFTSPMKLLDPKRMVKDEGVKGAMKIKANLMKHPKLKKRVEGMRATFKKYEDQLIAFGIIVEK